MASKNSTIDSGCDQRFILSGNGSSSSRYGTNEDERAPVGKYDLSFVERKSFS